MASQGNVIAAASQARIASEDPKVVSSMASQDLRLGS